MPLVSLGRHPGLLWAWACLAGPAEFGQAVVASLRHRDLELVSMRSSWNSGGYYHWEWHRVWSRLRGKGPEYADRLARGPDAPGWDDREATLLRAVDELHDDLGVSTPTLAALRDHFDERQLIEICFVAGHYELLAMALGSIDAPFDGWRRARDPDVGPLPRRRRLPSTSRPLPSSASVEPAGPSSLPLRAWFPASPTAMAVLASQTHLRRLLLGFARRSSRFATLDAGDHHLAVLRTLSNSGAGDECAHQVSMAGAGALDNDDIEEIMQGPDAPGCSPRQATLLRAVDELDVDYFISDETWRHLARFLDARQLIELGFLVGHHRTFAMMLNTLAPSTAPGRSM
ncbi:MAG: hypothetical protein ACRD0G_13980 [Acidimicrobiales bacterium]